MPHAHSTLLPSRSFFASPEATLAVIEPRPRMDGKSRSPGRRRRAPAPRSSHSPAAPGSPSRTRTWRRSPRRPGGRRWLRPGPSRTRPAVAPFQLAYTVVLPPVWRAAPTGGVSGIADPLLERRSVAEVGPREFPFEQQLARCGCTRRSRVRTPSRRTRCRSAAAACRPCIRHRSPRRGCTGPASVAVRACWSSLSTSPRDGPVAGTEVPPPVSWQQWSSNMVTVEPGPQRDVVLPLEGGARAELEARAACRRGSTRSCRCRC